MQGLTLTAITNAEKHTVDERCTTLQNKGQTHKAKFINDSTTIDQMPSNREQGFIIKFKIKL